MVHIPRYKRLLEQHIAAQNILEAVSAIFVKLEDRPGIDTAPPSARSTLSSFQRVMAMTRDDLGRQLDRLDAEAEDTNQVEQEDDHLITRVHDLEEQVAQLQATLKPGLGNVGSVKS